VNVQYPIRRGGNIQYSRGQNDPQMPLARDKVDFDIQNSVFVNLRFAWVAGITRVGGQS